MLTQAIPKLGVAPQPPKAAYEDLLDALEAHFQTHPYKLGGRPSIGDFRLLAPLYAHLGRDPYPLNLMKARAPSLHRGSNE